MLANQVNLFIEFFFFKFSNIAIELNFGRKFNSSTYRDDVINFFYRSLFFSIVFICHYFRLIID